MRENELHVLRLFILSVMNIRVLINVKILWIKDECCNFRVNTKIIEMVYNSQLIEEKN